MIVDDMILNTPILVFKGFKKKTQAQFYKDLKIGDDIEFKMKLENKGRNGNSAYAHYITAINHTQNTSITDSLNMTSKNIDKLLLDLPIP